MASTYVSKATRALIIESMIDAMFDMDGIGEEQIEETQAWLAGLNNSELRRECDNLCPEEWERLA
jgi:hypothetical protein